MEKNIQFNISLIFTFLHKNLAIGQKIEII